MAEVRVYFAVVGVLSLVTAVALFYRRISVLLYGEKVVGEVVGHATRESDDAVFHFPTISFIDSRGQEHQFSSVAGSTGKRPMLGARVPVRYLAEKPSRAYISTFLHMWSAPFAFALLGVAGCAAFLKN